MMITTSSLEANHVIIGSCFQRLVWSANAVMVKEVNVQSHGMELAHIFSALLGNNIHLENPN
ncbi:hypothetical protein KY290_017530 [Solanum tuberosum]|uniref:Uncharacterized protein n=1 Tax=Solanum tuberosum TaxID=4113 RepID=A0ABQ7VBN3_SOLTU|nr:hypothetical protein KY290_017530 [Solanum tuberosum]